MYHQSPPMVHIFDCLGKSFALDVYSGSLFEVDEITKKILLANSSDFTSGEFSCYAQDEFAEARREIESLKKENILFTTAPKVAPPEFNGIIKSMCLNVSHACNLACAYCFADGGDYGAGGGHMHIDTAKAAIDFLASRSGHNYNLEVDFFGGEPLLNFEVVKQTVLYARSLEKKHNKNFRFTLTTNAMHLPEEAIKFINAQMHNVVISIDGRKDVHNSTRKTASGKDSFDVVLQNAKKLVATRTESYFVRGTFTNRNLDFMQDVLAMYESGFTNISLEPVVLPDNHPLALGEAHVDAVCAEYEKLACEYVKRRASDKWFTFFHFYLNLYDGPCEKKLLTSCGAGCAYIAVDPSGKIYPCHQFVGMPAYQIGDVLKDTYDKLLPLKFGRKNHVTAKPVCDICWAKYYCGGGCAAANVKYNGKLSEPHAVFCALMKKRIECALAVWAVENS